jgi:hypothetical protein
VALDSPVREHELVQFTQLLRRAQGHRGRQARRGAEILQDLSRAEQRCTRADFEPEAAKIWVEKYFGPIPKSEVPAAPDLAEPRQEKEIKATRKDALANRPALAFAYHMPPRNTPQYYAMGLLDRMLTQSDDSLLYEDLVKKHGYTGRISGGINVDLGDMFDYDGPMLWTTYLTHDPSVTADQIMASVDSAIDSLQSKPVEQKLLDRNVTKMRSYIYDPMVQLGGIWTCQYAGLFCAVRRRSLEEQRLGAEFSEGYA